MLNASAKELAMRMWMGELSSVEVTQFYIDRIEKHNPAINAVIAERFEAALDEARQADEKVRRGEPLGALHGLPMTIKDAYEVTGLTCEVGHLPSKGESPIRMRLWFSDCERLALSFLVRRIRHFTARICRPITIFTVRRITRITLPTRREDPLAVRQRRWPRV